MRVRVRAREDKQALVSLPLPLRALILHKGPTLVTSSNSNYLPKVPSLNTTPLGIRILTYEFWGDTIQSISLGIH